MNLKDLSTKRKITIMLMLSSTLVIIVTCSLFYTLVIKHFHRTYYADLQNLATIVGNNCQAALLFNVPEDATRVLQTLEHRPSIQSAEIYDSFNSFANFNQRQTSGHPKSSATDFNFFHTTTAKVEKSILLADGSIIGKIILTDDMREISESKKKISIILLISATIALIIAYSLTSLLQQLITVPLSNLTKLATRMASRDFSLPDIESAGSDEIGQLTKAFHNMGTRLKQSYLKLEQYSHHLEEQVGVRTKELQEALKQSQERQALLIQSEKMAALGLLVAGVAHEINNNLNFISSAIPAIPPLLKNLYLSCDTSNPPTKDEVCKKNLQYMSKINKLLENANEGVCRTQKIINDLDSFSRPSCENFTLVQLNDEIKLTLSLLKFEIGHNIDVELSFQEDSPPVHCIKDQINQVFMNILLNAIHAVKNISKRGKIWITTSKKQSSFIISFRDNGAGISKEMQHTIFDPFFTTKPVGQGTGLGLSITYGIIKNHSGRITVNSAPGEGSEFTIELPLTDQYMS